MCRPRVGADNEVGGGDHGGQLFEGRAPGQVDRAATSGELLAIVFLERRGTARQYDASRMPRLQVLDDGCVIVDRPIAEIPCTLAAAGADDDQRATVAADIGGKSAVRIGQRDVPAQRALRGAGGSGKRHHRLHGVFAVRGVDAPVCEQPLEVLRACAVEADS